MLEPEPNVERGQDPRRSEPSAVDGREALRSVLERLCAPLTAADTIAGGPTRAAKDTTAGSPSPAAGDTEVAHSLAASSETIFKPAASQRETEVPPAPVIDGLPPRVSDRSVMGESVSSTAGASSGGVDPFAETRRALAELEIRSAELRRKLGTQPSQPTVAPPAVPPITPPVEAPPVGALLERQLRAEPTGSPQPAPSSPASGDRVIPIVEQSSAAEVPDFLPFERPPRVEAAPEPAESVAARVGSEELPDRVEHAGPAAETRVARPRIRRRAFVAAAGLALMTLVGGGAWRAQQVASGSHERLAALRQGLDGGGSTARTGDGATEGGGAAAVVAPDVVHKLCAEAETIGRELGPMAELAGVAGSAAQVVGRVPQIGDQAAGRMALASASADTIAALRTACEVIQPLVSAPASGTDVSALVATLGPERERLRGAATRLRAARAQLALVDQRVLSDAEHAIYRVLHDRLPGVSTRMALLAELPGLLGYDGQRTFLVLGQNGDELRPTGGFIGTAGLLTFDQGRLIDRQYGSSFAWDLPADRRVTPPEPLQRHMAAGYWQLKESNWMPDFPTAAQQARYFHEQVRPEPLAGVIAVDQNVVELLLELTGPVEVPRYGEVVSAANVRERMEYHTHFVPNWGEEERKGFVSALFGVLIERLNNLPRERFGDLALTLETALDRQYIQVWAVDDRAEQAIADLGWDGRMLQTDGDYLYAVSANVAMNKVNREVEQALGYEVAGEADGRLVGRATFTLRNRRPTTDPGPYPTADLIDYLRVYVPAGSELISAAGLDQSVTAGSECGRTVFGGLVTVKPGTERRIVLTYRLPSGIQAREYSLLIQKQPGTNRYPLSVRAFGGPEASGGQIDTASAFNWADGRLAAADQLAGGSLAAGRPACAVQTAPPQVLQPPKEVVIPRIGVRAGTVELGVGADGFLEAPQTGSAVGWYRDTARPGQVGNMIASGHVDWEKQAAVFGRLRELKKGDEVVVVAQDGVRYRYRVDWMKSFDPVQAPLGDILGPTTNRWLTLITCGGTFNQTTRQYSERLVVRAQFVGTE